MRYGKGEIIVTGNPSIAWIEKMGKMGMCFTLKNGKVIAYFDGRGAEHEKAEEKKKDTIKEEVLCDFGGRFAYSQF